jgi:hypothetical protein
MKLEQKTLNRLAAMLTQAQINSEENTDEQALNVQALYKEWENIDEGTELAAGKRVNYLDVLYKVIQTHVKQSSYNPKDATSLFTPIKKETETGTIDNPIAWVQGMEAEEGLYYTENDILYLCTRSSGTGLYYNIVDLVGTYFEVVE